MTTVSPLESVALESPAHVQVSLAAAMTLGLKPGRFWRGAKLTCVNLLLTYGEGCAANCAYCGLARERDAEEDGSFIRVSWPTYSAREIIDRMKTCPDAHRVCISMITHRRAVEDTLAIARAIRAETNIPISGLISPTLVRKPDLEAMKAAGIDKIGVAFDAATPEIFDELRGAAARGPHRWARYWECFKEAVAVFGAGHVGSHLIVGLGETEEEMVRAFQRVHDLGGVNHLFSFYPEAGTRLDQRVPPPMEQYRRVQLAAEIIDRGLAGHDDFRFDSQNGRILSFGIANEELDRLIDEGQAFMTRGCAGRDGRVACNRPFANSAPGPGLRNYPFPPNAEDVARIRRQLAGDWVEPLPVIPAGRSPKGIRKNPRKAGRIHFFAPTIKHFETDELANSATPFFVPISVTG
ncbi:MAG: radical SAM protein, partial [Candidatus Sumerlaeota bacterium]|nr:radical SAM protein [Candidatus Sumerlaeota bacterium]